MTFKSSLEPVCKTAILLTLEKHDAVGFIENRWHNLTTYTLISNVEALPKSDTLDVGTSK